MTSNQIENDVEMAQNTPIDDKTSELTKSSVISEEKKERSNIQKFITKWGGWIFLGAMVLTFIVLGALEISFGQVMINITYWFKDFAGNFGIYIGIFLISTFGNFTVIFPVPYTFALIAVSTLPGMNPILIGLAGALGATIGEVTAWAIGRSGQEALGESESIKRMKKYVDRGWAPALVFIFAATPLPDDAFLMVLGFANYKFKKILPWCFLGKFVLCFLSAAVPIWLMDIPMTDPLGSWLFDLYNAGITTPVASWGDWFLGLFGIDLAAAAAGTPPTSTSQDIWVSTIMWIATLVIVTLMVYIDWDKIGEKRRKKRGNNHKEYPDNLVEEDPEEDPYHPNNIFNDKS